MTCPSCGCEPNNPWYDPCDNPECPCGQAEAEDGEDPGEMFSYPVPDGDDAARLLGY